MRLSVLSFAKDFVQNLRESAVIRPRVETVMAFALLVFLLYFIHDYPNSGALLWRSVPREIVYFIGVSVGVVGEIVYYVYWQLGSTFPGYEPTSHHALSVYYWVMVGIMGCALAVFIGNVSRRFQTMDMQPVGEVSQLALPLLVTGMTFLVAGVLALIVTAPPIWENHPSTAVATNRAYSIPVIQTEFREVQLTAVREYASWNIIGGVALVLVSIAASATQSQLKNN